MFDVHTPQHLEALDGGIFLDETEDDYCVWRTDYHPKRRVCTYVMDVFHREGSMWARETEIHEEKAYSPEELTAYLQQVGFTQIRQYGNRKLRPPRDGEERIFLPHAKRRQRNRKRGMTWTIL